MPLALQAAQQFQNLRLRGHVESRSDFVGDEQVRPQRQRAGAPDPLALAAGKLARFALAKRARVLADKFELVSARTVTLSLMRRRARATRRERRRVWP